jgi:exodeoxyribonuclease VII large subunit
MTVSELNRRVKGVLEAKFELAWVTGELSNVTRAASGHWYFVLKDANAQVRCVMFRSRAQTVSFTPENGLAVDVRALPSLYEARGEFQLGVESMRRAGLGSLFEAFERLKKKLAAEGLFDQDRKRDLPTFPRTVGIVTSLKAAALRDVITTFHRRAPMIRLVIYPTAVQGADAPREIATAIDAAAARISQDAIDALLVCRGGGSMEDLWAFNDEIVARAISRFQSQTGLAVVSGVGHETDFTIADFVADVRAPTPTAGAELLSPDTREWRANLAALSNAMMRAAQRQLTRDTQRLDYAARSLISPTTRIAHERERLSTAAQRMTRALHAERATRVQSLAHLAQRVARLTRTRPDIAEKRADVRSAENSLREAITSRLHAATLQLAGQARALSHLDPTQVLTRGYAMVSRKAAGSIVTSADALAPRDEITIRFADGAADAIVSTSTPNTNK